MKDATKKYEIIFYFLNSMRLSLPFLVEFRILLYGKEERIVHQHEFDFFLKRNIYLSSFSNKDERRFEYVTFYF